MSWTSIPIDDSGNPFDELNDIIDLCDDLLALLQSLPIEAKWIEDNEQDACAPPGYATSADHLKRLVAGETGLTAPQFRDPEKQAEWYRRKSGMEQKAREMADLLPALDNALRSCRHTGREDFGPLTRVLRGRGDDAKLTAFVAKMRQLCEQAIADLKQKRTGDSAGPNVFTPGEVAKKTRRDRSTITRECADGFIKGANKVRGRWEIPAGSFEHLMPTGNAANGKPLYEWQCSACKQKSTAERAPNPCPHCGKREPMSIIR